MDSRDLMIGDWVRMKDCPNFKFQMEDVSGTSMFNRYADNGQTCVPYAYDEIEPIPLTDAILKMNGFEYYHKNFASLEYPTNGTFVLEYMGDVDDNVWRVYTTCYIRYVHELQHALKLFNIDKEITLA